MQSEFEDFFNENPPYDWDYSSPPTIQDVQDKIGDLWENVMKKGFATVVPPSTTVNTAAQTLGDWLRNNPATNDGGAGFYAQVSSFFATLMGGMAGFAITTPPAPLILSAPFSDKELVSSTFASQILACATTGVVTNIGTGVPQNLA